MTWLRPRFFLFQVLRGRRELPFAGFVQFRICGATPALETSRRIQRPNVSLPGGAGKETGLSFNNKIYLTKKPAASCASLHGRLALQLACVSLQR